MSRMLFCEIIAQRNYIEYRVKNETANTYQLRLWVDGEYLCGEFRDVIK